MEFRLLCLLWSSLILGRGKLDASISYFLARPRTGRPTPNAASTTCDTESLGVKRPQRPIHIRHKLAIHPELPRRIEMHVNSSTQFGTNSNLYLVWTKLQALSTQDMQCRDAKQMEPVCVNGSVHTAHKQHQRVCVGIRARASCVNEALGTTAASIVVYRM